MGRRGSSRARAGNPSIVTTTTIGLEPGFAESGADSKIGNSHKSSKQESNGRFIQVPFLSELYGFIIIRKERSVACNSASERNIRRAALSTNCSWRGRVGLSGVSYRTRSVHAVSGFPTAHVEDVDASARNCSLVAPPLQTPL